MTLLVPMTEAEYGEFVSQSIPGYAAQKVAAGEWTSEKSLDLARRAFEKLLPRGLDTEGHHLFTIRETRDSQALGVLWYAEQERRGSRIAYIYEIRIHPGHQRKGHASAALGALEAEVSRRGLAGIALHVFGHNLAAQALYEKRGYAPTDIMMFKDLRR